MTLNPEQKAAVHYISGPLLVLAGAGSGKTRVITQKIAYLIEQCQYAPRSVVAVTFTNKAAKEMKTRINQTLPAAKRQGLKIATFHTLGLNIIKHELEHCHRRSGFSILDSEDSQYFIRQCLPAHKVQDKTYVAQIQQQLSNWKNDLITPLKAAQQPTSNLPHVVDAAAIYADYEEILLAYNALDFDDLIALPVKLLSHHRDIRERWQNRIRHLLVDEYQDSNASQYELVKLLTGVSARFTVVGDDAQSIYAWRGARPENLAQLQTDFPTLKIIKLEQNYRSTNTILQAANQLITHNPHVFDKKLWSALGMGEQIKVQFCQDEQDEAEQVVADMIYQKIRFHKKLSDMAILYRGNHQARLFEKALRQQNIYYHLSGGQSWFAKAEIKDFFAYCKLLCNDTDDASFLRIINTPKRGIGETTLKALAQYAKSRDLSLLQCAHHLALTELLGDKPRQLLNQFKETIKLYQQKLQSHPIPQVLRELISHVGYEAYCFEQTDSPLKAQKRLDNIEELIEWIARLIDKKPEQTLADVVHKLILIDRLEQQHEQQDDTVQLMTLHAAKGLEFKVVYLVGMEEELLPHRSSIENAQIDEERRLAYVGITRAQEYLCLTLARQRRRQGQLQDCQPSRFLDELPKEAIEWHGRHLKRDEAKSKLLARSHLAGIKSLLT